MALDNLYKKEARQLLSESFSLIQGDSEGLEAQAAKFGKALKKIREKEECDKKDGTGNRSGNKDGKGPGVKRKSETTGEFIKTPKVPQVSIKEDAVSDISEIDFKPIEIKLEELLGIRGIQLNAELGARGEIKFKSQDLLQDAGIFKAVLADVAVSTFNTDYSEENDSYWMTVHLNYNSKNGGSNGMQIMTAWYAPSTKSWEFKEV